MLLNKNGFNKWADVYDESMPKDSKEFPFIGYYDVLSKVVELVSPKLNQKIFDIGIGTGFLCEVLRKKGCKIYGVDFSDKMLKRAEKRIPDGIFYKADISNINFLKSIEMKFDRIISSYFFHHLTMSQKINLIEELYKNHLSNEGKIIIADVGFKTKKDYKNSQKKYEASWDKSEHYLCGDELYDHLSKKFIPAEYIQSSECAGIVVVS